MEDQFKHTRRFTVAVLLSILSLCVASLVLIGSASVPVISIGIPAMAGLLHGYTHITNRGKSDG